MRTYVLYVVLLLIGVVIGVVMTVVTASVVADHIRARNTELIGKIFQELPPMPGLLSDGSWCRVAEGN